MAKNKIVPILIAAALAAASYELGMLLPATAPIWLFAIFLYLMIISIGVCGLILMQVVRRW